MLVMADVAGKSVPAALLMATLQASLRTLASQGMSLVQLAERLNRYACAHSLGGQRFTTAVIAHYDPATRELDFLNAGHNSPVVRRMNGSIGKLESSSLPFGITPDAPFLFVFRYSATRRHTHSFHRWRGRGIQFRRRRILGFSLARRDPVFAEILGKGHASHPDEKRGRFCRRHTAIGRYNLPRPSDQVIIPHETCPHFLSSQSVSKRIISGCLRGNSPIRFATLCKVAAIRRF